MASCFPDCTTTPESLVSGSEKYGGWGTLTERFSKGKTVLEGRPPPRDMRPGVLISCDAAFKLEPILD